MKNVSNFLTEVAESRRRAQIIQRSGFIPPLDLKLPEALEVALRYRFRRASPLWQFHPGPTLPHAFRRRVDLRRPARGAPLSRLAAQFQLSRFLILSWADEPCLPFSRLLAQKDAQNTPPKGSKR